MGNVGIRGGVRNGMARGPFLQKVHPLEVRHSSIIILSDSFSLIVARCISLPTSVSFPHVACFDFHFNVCLSSRPDAEKSSFFLFSWSRMDGEARRGFRFAIDRGGTFTDIFAQVTTQSLSLLFFLKTKKETQLQHRN